MDYTALDLDDLQSQDLTAAVLNPQLDISMLGDLQNEFGYESFLQGPPPDALGDSGGVDFMLDAHQSPDGSSSSNTMDLDPVIQQQQQQHPVTHHGRGQRAIAPALAAQSSNKISKSTAAQKQRMERRGHTKSRRGCFNCKRRRIKCQETRPACGHCVKTGLKCEYPAAPTVIHQPSNQVPLFSLQDMRFFQHFLTVCTPHQPMSNESIWTHEIACLSQSYEYLMHAILGYSASELISTDRNLIAPAMMHRVKAIKAVKKSLKDMSTLFPSPPPGSPGAGAGSSSDSCCDGSPVSSRAMRSSGASGSNSALVPASNSFSPITEQGNALMATCFALSFQSVNLDDGMLEFMTFIRGIVIVAMQLYLRGGRFIFTNLQHEDKMVTLRPLMDAKPLVSLEVVEPALRSIKNLRPLVPKDGVEEQFYEFLENMALKLKVKNSDAYEALSNQYGWWMMLPHSDFQPLLNLSNPVLLLLYTHWIALKHVFAPITEVEYYANPGTSNFELVRKKLKSVAETGMSRWLRWLNRLVRPEWQSYNEWPSWVMWKMEDDASYFVDGPPGDREGAASGDDGDVRGGGIRVGRCEG